jgi:hypothetical protein
LLPLEQRTEILERVNERLDAPYTINWSVSRSSGDAEPVNALLGTPVRVVEQPVKMGWVGDTLYAEVHPNQDQAIQLEQTGRFDPAPAPDVPARIVEMTRGLDAAVDWQAAEQLMRERRGIPAEIGRLRAPPKIPVAAVDE